jgi:hypothetical protein
LTDGAQLPFGVIEATTAKAHIVQHGLQDTQKPLRRLARLMEQKEGDAHRTFRSDPRQPFQFSQKVA